MNRISLFLTCSALITLVLSCGSNNNFPPKLNSDQRAQFSEVFGSVGETIEAVSDARKSQLGQDLLGLRERGPMAELLRGRCDILVQPTKVSSDQKISDLNVVVKVSGQSCPISLNFYFKATGDNTHASIVTEGNYAVIDPQYAALSDVTGWNFKGQADAIYSIPQKIVSGTATLEGVVRSKKQGDVPIAFSAKLEQQGNVGKASVLFTAKFKDYGVAIRANVSSDGQSTLSEYFINEEQVSERELGDLLRKPRLPVQKPEGPSQWPNPG